MAQLRPAIDADGFSVKAAVFAMLPEVAVSVADWVDATAETVAEKLVEVDPAGTVMLDGTATAALLLVRLTLKPPESAAELRETPHAAVPALANVLDPQASTERAGVALGALRLMRTLEVTFETFEDNLAVWVVVNAPDLAVKLTVVPWLPIYTLAGTVSIPLELASATVKPERGARELIVMVQVVELEGARVVELQLIADVVANAAGAAIATSSVRPVNRTAVEMCRRSD